MKNILLINAMILLTVAFMWFVGYALDESFDNKDRMLCNSAKVSGNVEYLKKCTCFYAGENIRCIYGRIK